MRKRRPRRKRRNKSNLLLISFTPLCLSSHAHEHAHVTGVHLPHHPLRRTTLILVANINLEAMDLAQMIPLRYCLIDLIDVVSRWMGVPPATVDGRVAGEISNTDLGIVVT